MPAQRVMYATALLAAGTILLSACNVPGLNSGTASAPSSTASDTSDVTFVEGLAVENNVKAGTGDLARPTSSPEAKTQWLQVAAGSTFDLNPLLMNARARVMYRFDDDTADPSKSACDEKCAELWPPVEVGKNTTIYFKDVSRDSIGVLQRPDGKRQLTIAGQPAYYYSKDTKTGETKGHGVGDKWFGLRPDGAKASAATAPPVTREAGENKAELFDRADFAKGAKESLIGLNCRNVSADNTASSVKVTGKITVWSEKDCKGKSLVLDEDVADLADVDFDNTVSSVAFG